MKVFIFGSLFGFFVHQVLAGDAVAIGYKYDGVWTAVTYNRSSTPKGGPQFKFTEAISFSVNCETQDEIDYFWEKLSADGGSTGPCGWLKDKFGLSWQVSPVVLGDMLADPDPSIAERVMKAMMEMDKIDIAALKKAYESGNH